MQVHTATRIMREPEFAFGSLMEITERPEIVFVQGEAPGSPTTAARAI